MDEYTLDRTHALLLFYLSIEAAMRCMGSTNKIATCSGLLFKKVKDMRKCRVNGSNKYTDDLWGIRTKLSLTPCAQRPGHPPK
jgi:hypothetical protein